MSRKRRFKDARSKRDGRTFVPLPLEVLESRAYLDLSPRAKALMLDMLAQYRGNNNGDLCAAFRIMRPRGWKSERTLFAARKELARSGIIHETRKGARPNRATLFGFTFFELDEHPKLEVTLRSFPRGQWRMKDPSPPIAVQRGDSLTAKEAVEGA